LRDMYTRILNISSVLSRKSLFLFGARQVGKTTYLRQSLPKASFIDLLSTETFREFSHNPGLLGQRIKDNDSVVVIDEIQLLPTLLNEAQRLLGINPSLRFVFTGSSARKLKRNGANLLGGRASQYSLFPLTSAELSHSRLSDQLKIGSIPSIIDSSDPYADLKDYIALYLQQEILFEGLVRNIEAFSRFLTIIGLCNGKQINFTAIANDCQISPHILREYFQIIEDTFIGLMLPAYQKTTKRKPVTSSKFYLFDIGVTNHLLKRTHIEPGSEHYGEALEHLIVLEIRAYLTYTNSDISLTYWRSNSKLEVDIVLGDEIAIEVKGKTLVSERDAKGLHALAEELTLKRKIIIANERMERRLESGVEVIPVALFLEQLWSGVLI
jgi:uncharacterized protein